jgi:hypothetical protein
MVRTVTRLGSRSVVQNWWGDRLRAHCGLNVKYVAVMEVMYVNTIHVCKPFDIANSPKQD